MNVEFEIVYFALNCISNICKHKESFHLGIYKIKCYICLRQQLRNIVIPRLWHLSIKVMKNKNIFLLFTVFTLFSPACVKPEEPSESFIHINELLPVNKTIAADQNGEYDDWIELYNTSASSVDISGYFLSDDKDLRSKWKFPSGTTVQGMGFLIVWADEDITQAGLHANFKLSSQGEEVFLTSPDGILRDRVRFSPQSEELSWARNPDGTGTFRWQTPTFNKSNGQ
jgi:hypothetical protein